MPKLFPLWEIPGESASKVFQKKRHAFQIEISDKFLSIFFSYIFFCEEINIFTCKFLHEMEQKLSFPVPHCQAQSAPGTFATDGDHGHRRGSPAPLGKVTRERGGIPDEGKAVFMS